MKFLYDEINECSSNMNQIFLNINHYLQEIKDKMESFKASENWVGPAADYFNTNMKLITDSFDEVNTQLQNSFLYLEKVRDEYNSLDKKIIVASGNAISNLESNVNDMLGGN